MQPLHGVADDLEEGVPGLIRARSKFAMGLSVENIDEYMKYGNECIEELSTVQVRGGLFKWLTCVMNIFRLVRKDQHLASRTNLIFLWRSP